MASHTYLALVFMTSGVLTLTSSLVCHDKYAVPCKVLAWEMHEDISTSDRHAKPQKVIGHFMWHPDSHFSSIS